MITATIRIHKDGELIEEDTTTAELETLYARFDYIKVMTPDLMREEIADTSVDMFDVSTEDILASHYFTR